MQLKTPRGKKAPRKHADISRPGVIFVLQISRTKSPAPVCNSRQCTRSLAHRNGAGSGGGGDRGTTGGLLHRLGLGGGTSAGASGAARMTRDCRSSRYGHTSAATPAPTAASTMAVRGSLFFRPSFHALCERCILLVVGVCAVLELHLSLLVRVVLQGTRRGNVRGKGRPYLRPRIVVVHGAPLWTWMCGRMLSVRVASLLRPDLDPSTIRPPDRARGTPVSRRFFPCQK